MLRVLCSLTPTAFRDTRGLSDYLEFNHIIEHWLFCLSVNMWSERFLVALFAHSCQGREQLLANLDEGEFTEGHDPLSRSRAGHCQTATRLSPHEIVKFGTSICNNRRRSPDRRPWLRSSLSRRLARGCPALETCGSAAQ